MRKISCVIFILIITAAAKSVISSHDEFTINLTDPNSVSKNGLVWEPADKVRQTGEGLIFKNDAPNTSVDFNVLTKAYPIGLSWRQAYGNYVSQYSSMDVPWRSDEETAVKWILAQEPDFFEKQIPIIGYIQFLCETSMRANQPLSEMKISIGWGVGGLSSIPKDKSVYKNRDNIPWRFKASDEKN